MTSNHAGSALQRRCRGTGASRLWQRVAAAPRVVAAAEPLLARIRGEAGSLVQPAIHGENRGRRSRIDRLTRSSELQPAGVPHREEESETPATNVPGSRRAGPSRAVPPWRGCARLCSCHCSRRQGVGVTRAPAAAAIARAERTHESKEHAAAQAHRSCSTRRAMQTSPPAGCSDRAPRVGIYGRGSQRAAWTEWTKSSACPS
jgi:hypothetical protein